MLRATVCKNYASFRLDVDVALDSSTTMVVVGESGSGKTTLLRLLAGLEKPDGGRIALDEAVYFDEGDCGGSGERGGQRDGRVGGRGDRVAVPASRRDVGYVSQDYALFPHLSLLENVAFGLRAMRLPAREVRERAGAMLAQLGIADLAGRRPAQLSGGQMQRAALARALAPRPRLLLLDEPLSALDVKTRRAIRGELQRLLADLTCTTIYVTHSPIEALVFGDRISVIEAGRITQTGTRDDLLRHPRSQYVADLMGVNLFRGAIAGRSEGGLAQVRTPEGSLSVVDPGGEDDVFVAVNPREITLHAAAPAGSAQNVFVGPIEEIVPEPPFGDRLRVALGTRPPLVAEVTRSAVAALGLRVGLDVYATFKAAGVTTYR